MKLRGLGIQAGCAGFVLSGLKRGADPLVNDSVHTGAESMTLQKGSNTVRSTYRGY